MNLCPVYTAIFFLLILPFRGITQEASFWDQYNPASKHLFQYEGETGFHFFFQDSRGFIWGSDKDSKLIRFDGKEIVYFPFDPQDSTSHSGCDYWPNAVKFLEDREGHIWMFSSYVCVDRYDPVSGRFERVHESMQRIKHKITGHRFNSTHYLFEDSRKDIWIAVEGGLFKYSLDTNKLFFFPVKARVTMVFEDAFHNIWIKGETGQRNQWLERLDEATGQFVDRIKLDLPAPGPTSTNRMDSHCFLEGSDSILILSNFNLFFFDPRKKAIHFLQETPFGGDNFATTMYAEDGLFLFGTNRGELYRFSPSNGEFQKNLTLSEIASSTGLRDIFRTRDGVIWMIQKAPIMLLPKRTHFKKEPLPSDVPGYLIERLFTDAFLTFNGTVFFHTIRGLIPVRGSKTPAPALDLSIDGIRDPMNIIYNFDTDHQGYLWMVASFASQQKRLIHIRKYDKNGTLTYQYEGPYEIEDCRWNRLPIIHMKADRKGGLWIGSNGQLSYFDSNASSFVHQFCALDANFFEVFINCLFVDQDNDLWVGSHISGLLHFNWQSGQWSTFPLSDPGVPESKTIYSIYQGSKGAFWTGTKTGLVKFDKKTGQKRRYDQKDMLQSLAAVQIFEDHHQNLWVATGNWLARYDPERDQFIPFVGNDGVLEVSDSYSHADVLSDSSGFIFLPGPHFEVGYFHPDSVQINNIIPDIYFTGLQLFHEPVKPGDASGILQQSLDHTEKIVLQYAQNDFSIHYAAPSYIHPYQTVYATQLEGFQDDWQDAGTRQEARFTNLSPGTYVFKVKVRNHHGFWSKTPRTLTIVVLPPWYRTWWAYTLWIVLFLLLVLRIYRYQLRRQLALAEAQRLKELDRAKSQLYTNITHEFRTPLTIILGMTDEVKNDPRKWFNEGLRLIRRNGIQLLNLVNQMLDLSKLESGHTTLNLINGDIVGYLHYLAESFHSAADSKDIRLHFLSKVGEFRMDYDPEKMQHVLSNLLSNAIKFTPAGGDVYIQVAVDSQPSTVGVNSELPAVHFLLLTVQDTGLGIAPEHLPYIFDRFYQADATTTRRREGTGIGLALTQELVKLMGGRIEVKSEIDKGTIFTITLPVMQEAQKQEDTRPVVPKFDIAETVRLEPDFKAPPQEIAPGNRPLVLLIEDNVDVITYLSSFLSSDYQVETATDGQQGIDKAAELIPDLIVSDVMMPEKDGFEVCATLKKDERTSHIPIILLTAKSDTAAKLEGLTHGADVYLAKPFNKEELLIRMEKLIELRKQLQAHYQKTSDLLALSAKSTPTTEDRFLQKLIAIVEENLENEHFGLPDLCRKAYLSRSQLFRKLKALTGQSTTHFIRSIRLEKGKALLETTDLTIAEVAFRVGFGNTTYFYRIFKEKYGVAPSEMRK